MGLSRTESHPSANAALNHSFPYGGLEGGKRGFKGRYKMLDGYLERTATDLYLGEVNLFIPKGTRFLEVHFDVKERSIQKGQLSKVSRLLERGCREMLDLAKALEEDEKLKNITLIAGTTNPRMARIAIRKLGFHDAGAVKEELGMPNKLIYRPETDVVIFTTRDEIISQAEAIRTKRNQLREINRRHS
jgi:hypothetical protein